MPCAGGWSSGARRLGSSILLGWLLACVPPAAVPEKPKEGPGVQLVYDLDSGQADVPLTEGMAGVFAQGVARYGQDLRSQMGALVSARLVSDTGDKPGQWRTLELSARYQKSVFPARVSVTYDERGRLAGFFLEPGIGVVTEAELGEALRALPGAWSVAGRAAEHPEVSFGYRADEAQPVASQYKVLLLARTCAAVARGQLSLEERLTLPEALRGAPSCVLCEFQGGLQPTVRDLLHLLVTASDNTAADLLRAHFGWREVDAFAERQGVEHPPPLISTQGLFALECGAGPLADLAPEKRADYLSQLSAEERVEAADEAAREAFRDGPEGMKARCWRGQVPAEVGTAIAEAVDWPLRANELVSLYNEAQRGELESAAASRCFLDFMEQGGSGPVGLDVRFTRGGAKNGIEADIRSVGLVYETDRGPIALSLSVHRFTAEQADAVSAELGAAARSLAFYLYRRLPEPRR